MYDLGGGTFDVSIVEQDDQRTCQVNVVGTDGDSHLGGEDIDRE